MDNEAVATAIASLDAKMDSVVSAVNEMKANCVRTESSRDDDTKTLFKKVNNLTVKAENHSGRLDTHDRYFAYVATVLAGIIIAVVAAYITSKGGP